MNIEWWSIDKPIPYATNPRKINQSAVDKVAASIKEFGWQSPIVVDKNGVIVAGHTRLLAAHKMEAEQVPVHIADNLTDAQAKAFRIMDNRSHQESQWDDDLLRITLEDLNSLEFDLSLTGFDQVELQKLFDPAEATAPGQFNEYGEDINTQYQCPKCAYTWSGKPK